MSDSLDHVCIALFHYIGVCDYIIDGGLSRDEYVKPDRCRIQAPFCRPLCLFNDTGFTTLRASISHVVRFIVFLNGRPRKAALGGGFVTSLGSRLFSKTGTREYFYCSRYSDIFYKLAMWPRRLESKNQNSAIACLHRIL